MVNGKIDNNFNFQPSLFDPCSPAEHWDNDSAKHALDDLFSATLQYRSSVAYNELLDFIRKFRFYSPYNSLLIHIQMPGAHFVAPSYRWGKKYGRIIKPNAKPIMILQPNGPVMFVYDVTDTEPEKNALPFPLPPEVEAPFAVYKGHIGNELDRIIENAKRDGIRILGQAQGSQGAGSIQLNTNKNVPPLKFYIGKKEDCQIYARIPVRYEILYNSKLTKEAIYVTIVHELAHLYCGHMGTPDIQWWPDRRGLNIVVREFEVESVAHLVCVRLGIDSPSASYLSSYLRKNKQIPKISLECLMKVAGLVEKMGRERLKMRPVTHK